MTAIMHKWLLCIKRGFLSADFLGSHEEHQVIGRLLKKILVHYDSRGCSGELAR